jgi:NADH-quinone oxidoreductase subunit N
VTFQQIFESLLSDTTQVSLPAFRPELALCGTIVLMLLVRVFNLGRREDAFFIALAGSALSLYLAAPWIHLGNQGRLESQELFTGLLVYDTFSVYFRALLLFFAVLFVLFTRISGIPDQEDGPDFYTLVLGATLGMCLMASANHLLMVFLGVEMASVPSYALAGMLKGRRQSSEAALKYVVYGAGAAGVMLYGISLLAGVLGSVHLPTMAAQLADLIQSGASPDRTMVLVLGALMMAVGLAFKLSAVPFHFWCPDVFEGASAEIDAFLSVASKAAALALLVRVVVGFGHTDLPAGVAQAEPAAATATADANVATDAPDAADMALATAGGGNASLEPVRRFLVGLVALFAAITCTLGNLAAYGQTNIKRLLAYSTIAHAGYMMMPVAAGLALAGSRPLEAEGAVAALAFYTGVYLFMNLGAFAIVAFLRNELHSEQIAAYSGLVRRSPGMALCLALILLSLLGMPPLVGLWAKVAIFAAMINAAEIEPALWMLIGVAGLNTVLSLFYYVRVVKVMMLDAPLDEGAAEGVPMFSWPGLYVLAVTLPVLILGVWWDGLNQWAQAAASQLL